MVTRIIHQTVLQFHPDLSDSSWENLQQGLYEEATNKGRLILEIKRDSYWDLLTTSKIQFGRIEWIYLGKRQVKNEELANKVRDAYLRVMDKVIVPTLEVR